MDNLLKFKSIEFNSYKADGNGNLIISGYGAVFGNKDSYGDVIEPGAFAETLIERKDRIALCYQHDIWRPIGKIISIEEDDHGLKLDAMISASEQDIQTKIKEGILKEMSIGYREIESIQGVKDGEAVCYLKKLKLIEISIVTIAANPLALISGMKGEEKVEYLKNEFDRVIAILRNDNIQFEVDKLKSITLSTLADNSESRKEIEKEFVTAKDYLNILNQ